MKELYTERKALKEYVDWIREERRRLGDEYWKAIERLKQLDETQPANTATDLVEKLQEMIHSQNDTLALLKDKIPNIPLEEYLRANHLKLDTQEEIISKVEIQKERDKEETKKPVRRGKRKDIKILTETVASFIKESERPVKLKEVQEFLENKGYKISNMAHTMGRMMEYNKRIEKVYKGFYQYR